MHWRGCIRYDLEALDAERSDGLRTRRKEHRNPNERLAVLTTVPLYGSFCGLAGPRIDYREERTAHRTIKSEKRAGKEAFPAISPLSSRPFME